MIDGSQTAVFFIVRLYNWYSCGFHAVYRCMAASTSRSSCTQIHHFSRMENTVITPHCIYSIQIIFSYRCNILWDSLNTVLQLLSWKDAQSFMSRSDFFFLTRSAGRLRADEHMDCYSITQHFLWSRCVTWWGWQLSKALAVMKSYREGEMWRSYRMWKLSLLNSSFISHQVKLKEMRKRKSIQIDKTPHRLL